MLLEDLGQLLIDLEHLVVVPIVIVFLIAVGVRVFSTIVVAIDTHARHLKSLGNLSPEFRVDLGVVIVVFNFNVGFLIILILVLLIFIVVISISRLGFFISLLLIRGPGCCLKLLPG